MKSARQLMTRTRDCSFLTARSYFSVRIRFIQQLLLPRTARLNTVSTKGKCGVEERWGPRGNRAWKVNVLVRPLCLAWSLAVVAPRSCPIDRYRGRLGQCYDDSDGIWTEQQRRSICPFLLIVAPWDSSSLFFHRKKYTKIYSGWHACVAFTYVHVSAKE